MGLSGLLFSEETHQQSLGLSTEVPRVTAKRTSDVTAPPPLTNWNHTLPVPPNGTCSHTDYPPSRGVPWKYTAEKISTDRSCPRCHFNKPNESLRLKFHQEVGYPALSKHGCVCKNNVMEVSKIVDQFNSQFSNPDPNGTRRQAPVMPKRISDQKTHPQ